MVRLLIWLVVAVAYLHCTEGSFGEGIESLTKSPTKEISNPMTRVLRKLGDFSSSISDTFEFMPVIHPTTAAGSKPLHAYYSSASSTSHNKHSWPLERTEFNHPIQSPVDVITSKAITMDLPMLDIIEPDLKGIDATFYNSGHTVYVYVNETRLKRPHLKGGPLKEKFIFEQMHFHWGSEDIWGSEHFIDGESYAVEIHAVHYNSKYATFEEAASKPDGLAVLTVFAEAYSEDNNLLEPLYSQLAHIKEPKASVTLDSNKALQWAHSALTTNVEYYTYPGSLTTPPYSENVVFILLPKPITMSLNQLSAFRQLHSEDHNHPHITDNKRQLQPLHNRPIVRCTKLQ